MGKGQRSLFHVHRPLREEKEKLREAFHSLYTLPFKIRSLEGMADEANGAPLWKREPLIEEVRKRGEEVKHALERLEISIPVVRVSGEGEGMRVEVDESAKRVGEFILNGKVEHPMGTGNSIPFLKFMSERKKELEKIIGNDTFKVLNQLVKELRNRLIGALRERQPAPKTAEQGSLFSF